MEYELIVIKRSFRGLRRYAPKNKFHTLLFLIVMITFFGSITYAMGTSNAINTLIMTANRLLFDTVFYTVALTTLSGALGRLLTEFELSNFLNWIFGKLMKPFYGMPGISFLGGITTFLSDNMAIIPFLHDNEFMKHFKLKQIPLLCNLGTSWGLGLFVVTALVGFGRIHEVLVGLIAALIGSVISVRLFAFFANRIMKGDWTPDQPERLEELKKMNKQEKISKKIDPNFLKTPFFERFLNAILTGGKFGVEIGIGMVPGVLVICSALMMFMKTCPENGYTGGPYEGIGIIPMISNFLSPFLEPVFGFTSDASLGLVMACLASVGAAVSLLKTLDSTLMGNEVAVFAAMSILWSGFISTHVIIMDEIGYRKLMMASLWTHLVAGLITGIIANLLYRALVMMSIF